MAHHCSMVAQMFCLLLLLLFLLLFIVAINILYNDVSAMIAVIVIEL